VRQSFTNGFMVLHGNRLEDLRDLLVHTLKAQPLGPLQPEVVLVQSNGMKHWLEMALADEHALGICAATRLELPSGFLWQAYRTVLGAAGVPAHMPFDKNSLVWRLVRLLPTLVRSDPVYQPLQHYLGQDAPGRRLYQLALQLADVLDGYQSYRADWLTDWAAGADGQDVLRSHDGRPVPLDATQAWQACLWRDIRADVGEGLADTSRAAVHARFLQALAEPARQGVRAAGLPPRIVVFGISSLPMQAVEALAALGQVCQVLMFVQNPCRHYWGDIVEGHDRLRQQVRRRQQPRPLLDGESTASHPLLASWGKQGRDYLHLLDGFDQTERYAAHFQRVDCFVDPAQGASPCHLARLQSAILNLEPGPELAEPDGSLTFVTAHSAQREVEVLHDQLLAWFDADPALQPGDVMVMVPDMEAFAPHVQAVFGRFAPGQRRHIPYAMADTTARQTPLVQALERLLALPTARLSLAEWLGLFEVPAVRQRFGLSEADVAQLHDWLAAAGVRWGLDAQHRQRWGVPGDVDGLDHNTWAFGLRRLLLGYAVGAGDIWGQTLPQAGLGSLDGPVLGALLQWVQAVNDAVQALSHPQTPADWHRTLHALVHAFFAAAPQGDAATERALQRLQEPLDTWLQRCEEAGLDTPLALEVVRDHWLGELDAPSLGQRFFGGGVQFGTLMPMRSIPFQVICLLGMNDGDYPRQQTPRDFDLMAQSWRAGDRSRREDDRYLFLEALLSARQRFYVSWQGRRATDNAEQPPSVLVAQLLDHLQAGGNPPDPVRPQPLQPFSRAYFVPGSPFITYDQDWAAVHQMANGHAIAEMSSLTTPVAASPTSLRLDDLRQLLRQPVEVFFKTRLRVPLDELDEVEQEAEPFELNPLERYQLGQQLLDAPDLDQATPRLRLSGQLPLAAFGERVAGELVEQARVVLRRKERWVQTYPHALPAQSVALEVNGVGLVGTLVGWCAAQAVDPLGPWPTDVPVLQLQQRTAAVLEDGGRRAKGHVLVGLWVQHLAACASGWPATSVQLGLDGEVHFPPLPREQALQELAVLVEAWQAAWRRPLPLAGKTGWAWAHAQARRADDPLAAAQAVFEGTYLHKGEHAESAYLERAFDGWADLQDDLPDWAERLYGPMARCLQTGVAQEAPHD
jgi:exodeoxyribonuclease V gamma subunit